MTQIPPIPPSEREIHTNPNGWDDHAWLANTWEAAQAAKAAADRADRTARAVHRLVLELDKHVVEGFKRLGVRIGKAEARASQSQIDAEEARSTAREAESATVRAFVEDAKPFARWKERLAYGVTGILFTLVTAAICHHCGWTP